MNEIETMEAAYRRLLRKLEDMGESVLFVQPMNNHRYLLVKLKSSNILIMYKRDVFHNFGLQFREKGYKGVGDTINCEQLKECVRLEVKTIYAIFPNAKVYSIKLEDFLNNSEKWVNKEGKEVRSIPIHLYKKEFDI